MGERTTTGAAAGTAGTAISAADAQYLESLVARATCGADMAALRALNDAMARVPASAGVVQAALRRVLAGGRTLAQQQQLGANLLHSLLVSSPAFRHAVGASTEWQRRLASLVASPAAPAPVRSRTQRLRSLAYQPRRRRDLPAALLSVYRRAERHPEQQPLHQQTHSIRRTVHRDQLLTDN